MPKKKGSKISAKASDKKPAVKGLGNKNRQKGSNISKNTYTKKSTSQSKKKKSPTKSKKPSVSLKSPVSKNNKKQHTKNPKIARASQNKNHKPVNKKLKAIKKDLTSDSKTTITNSKQTIHQHSVTESDRTPLINLSTPTNKTSNRLDKNTKNNLVAEENAELNLKSTHPAEFIAKQKIKLQELRDALLDQMADVAHDSLRTASESGGGAAFGQHMGDAGSEAYERDFALSLLSQEQDSLYEINEALRRIELGTYGMCELSGKPIPKERLEAIPWARYTVECQKNLEKTNIRRNRWESTPQFMDSMESDEETEEEESEEESRVKNKEQT